MSEEINSKLDDLAKSASEEDATQDFMNPVSPKKRGRPKGSRKPKPTIDEASGQPLPPTAQEQIDGMKPLVKPCWEMISKAGVKLAEDDRAALGPEELQILVDTSAACIHQYLPGALAEHANLIVMMVTLSNWSLKVYMMRQAKIQELLLQKGLMEAKAKAEAAPPTSDATEDKEAIHENRLRMQMPLTDLDPVKLDVKFGTA